MRPRPAPPLFIALVLTAGCASRSRLRSDGLTGDADTGEADGADASIDAGHDANAPDTFLAAETSSRSDVGGVTCADRETTCPAGDDFGPARSVRGVFDLCSTVVGQKVCGTLTLVFDREGCLLEVTGISGYPPAFVDCVVGSVSAKRWLCADGIGLKMFEACDP